MLSHCSKKLILCSLYCAKSRCDLKLKRSRTPGQIKGWIGEKKDSSRATQLGCWKRRKFLPFYDRSIETRFNRMKYGFFFHAVQKKEAFLKTIPSIKYPFSISMLFKKFLLYCTRYWCAVLFSVYHTYLTHTFCRTDILKWLCVLYMSRQSVRNPSPAKTHFWGSSSCCSFGHLLLQGLPKIFKN